MEHGNWRVDPGAIVIANGARMGVVEEVVERPDGRGIAHLIVRPDAGHDVITVPVELIDAVPSRTEIRLGRSAVPRAERADGERARVRAVGDGVALTDDYRGLLVEEKDGELRVPLVEERLRPEKRVIEQGEVRVHKRVETVPETIRLDLRRDDLEIERVPRNEILTEARQPGHDGEWLVVPVMKEVLVVEKRLVLTEEIRIRKREVVETREYRDLVRRERVEVEDATMHGVTGAPRVESSRQRAR